MPISITLLGWPVEIFVPTARMVQTSSGGIMPQTMAYPLQEIPICARERAPCCQPRTRVVRIDLYRYLPVTKQMFNGGSYVLGAAAQPCLSRPGSSAIRTSATRGETGRKIR